jgi:hypothetical protein
MEAQTMKDRQLVLNDLELEPVDAIALTKIEPGKDGTKPVSVHIQRQVLQLIGSFKDGDCFMSAETIAKRLDFDPRTIRATLRVLVSAGLLIESGSRNRRTRAVHWTEIGRRIPRPTAHEQPSQLSHSEATNCDTRSGQLISNCPDRSGQLALNCPDNQGSRCPTENEKYTKLTTTEPAGVVVVVEISKVLAKGPEAYQRATARGLTDSDMLELLREWQALPAAERSPGKLFNWLAVEGSYQQPHPPPVQSGLQSGRGDALSREQVKLESLRVRIMRAGRAAGASEQEIAKRLAECEAGGVRLGV